MLDGPALRLTRAICLLLAAAFLLAACASNPSVRAGGSADGRTSRGAAGVGWPF
jgi:hypothetical protein